ncbi:iripin-2-like [Panulirus ornatus]|uniref:iripin-2-like n=1 Tax=Panulirus ornatus TaxID=150431 RepID=UPI003A8BE00A
MTTPSRLLRADAPPPRPLLLRAGAPPPRPPLLHANPPRPPLLRCAPLRPPLLLLLATLVLLLLLLQAPLCGASLDRCFYWETNRGIEASFPKGVGKFGLNLFKKVVATRGVEESLVLSPYSVWSALCLAFFGSKGSTRAQLAQALRLSAKTTTFTNWQSLQERLVGGRSATGQGGGATTTTFVSTNKAYFAQHLRLDPCLRNTLPEMETLDFGSPALAADQINAVVSRATHGEITDLVNAAILTDVEFLLLNAVFFKGRWKTIFPEERTELRPFHASAGGDVRVPMMTVVDMFKYAPAVQMGATLVELPYERGFSLLVLLPMAGVRVEEVVANLSRKKVEQARGSAVHAEVQVAIPRFSITSRVDEQLKQVLGQLGVTDLFTHTADLEAFVQGNVRLNSVIHQATVRVTEEGTVAAGATGVLGTRVGPTKFTCDRPFIFVLVDDQMGLPIITGVYSGPDSGPTGAVRFPRRAQQVPTTT